MPTSRGPQALEAPSVSLVWIAPSLFLSNPDWLSRTRRRLILLGALRAPLWHLAVHIPSPFAGTMDYLGTIFGINKAHVPNGLRFASRPPTRNNLKLFAVRRADYGPFRIVGDTGAPNQSLLERRNQLWHPQPSLQPHRRRFRLWTI